MTDPVMERDGTLYRDEEGNTQPFYRFQMYLDDQKKESNDVKVPLDQVFPVSKYIYT